MAEKLTWQRIADEFAEKIENGELPPGTRIESEENLATRLNVPRHVAHRALDELHRKGLVVRQRRWGTVVADRRPSPENQRVAYLLDIAASRFQTDILSHIVHALDDGPRLMIATSRNDLHREADLLMKLREEVDGILCYPADGDENAPVFRKLADEGFPLVLVDRAPRGCEDLAVMTDNVLASEMAVKDLIDRGHRRIAFFGSSNDRVLSVRERYIGYRNAIEELGYASKPYERWIPLLLEENSELMYQTISDGFTVMRSLPEPPTAAFCVQDRLGAVLMETCTAHDLEIGVDFGLATFNDFGPSFFSQPWRIDRVVQRMQEVSEIAVHRLYAQMRGETIAKGPIRVSADLLPAMDTRTILTSLHSPIGND
jgi:DNA-binding LacI/PurR family transcriptional regulator